MDIITCTNKLRLIAACPRSGQNYISRILQKTGLNMGVGYIRGSDRPMFDMDRYGDTYPFADGVVSLSFITVPEKFEVILHQVRDPLKTISSATTEPGGTYNIIFSAIKKKPSGIRYKPFFDDFDNEMKKSPLFAMWSWYWLNCAIEEVADWRYRIEDIDEVYPEICDRLWVKPLPTVPETPRDFNTRPHINYTWKQLEAADKELCNKIREKGKEYGYD